MTFLAFVLGHAVAALLLFALSYIPGRRLTRSVAYASIWEELGIATALGMGINGFLVFALGLAGRLSPLPLLVTLLIPQLLSYREWRLAGRQVAELRRQRPASTRRKLLWGCLLLWPLGLPSLYPPTDWDATMYHLTLDKIFIQRHALVYAPLIRAAVFPQLNEMLFIPMLLFYDDVAAHMVQFVAMLMLAVTLYAWGLRTFSERAGTWAALLWLSNPLVVLLGGCAYIDVGCTYFVCTGTLAFFNGWSSKNRAWLVLAGVLFGFAASSKFTSLFLLATFGMVTLTAILRERRYSYAVLFMAPAVLIAAPWYLRSWLYTGNPVWPFFFRLFPNKLWSEADLTELHRIIGNYGTPKTLTNLLRLPWDLIVQHETFLPGEPLSVCYVFVLPSLLLFLSSNGYARRLMAIVGAYLVFWFWNSQQVRYLLVVLPLFTLAGAASLDNLFLRWPVLQKWAGRRWLHVALCMCLLLPAWTFVLRKVRFQRFVPVTREQREAYLAAMLPTYPIYAFLNQQRGQNYAVYAFGEERMTYFADGQFMGDQFGAARWQDVIEAAGSGKRLYDHLMGLGATHLLFGEARPLRLPDDDFFRSHFKRIYQQPGRGTLYELVTPVSMGAPRVRPAQTLSSLSGGIQM